MSFKGKTTSGKALLETDALQFRGGDLKLSIPFKTIKKVAARDGALSIAFPGGPLSLALGAAASKWADKIQHPPSRLDKLGVKPAQHVALVNVDDNELARQLEVHGAVVVRGRPPKGSDAIFFSVTSEKELARIARLKSSLAPAGSLWVIRPKGRPEISERAVMAAGKAAGLVDVKVVSFSPTHTAEKFVIPLKDRSPSKSPR